MNNKIHNDINEKLNFFRYILPRLTIYGVLLAAFVHFFTQIISTDQKIEFNRLAAQSEARLQERLVINETALSGFANLLKINGWQALEPVREYTQQMRDTYKQIYMFEALLGINPKEQRHLSEQMEAIGNSNYQVYRYVSRKSTTGKPSKPFNLLADTGVMFPVFFIDPKSSAVADLMGFDMMSAKVPREPLIRALVTGKIQATKPYQLQEGGMGYVIYKPLQQVVEPSGADAIGALVATVVVLIDPMVALVHDVIPRAKVELKYGDELKRVSNTVSPNPEDKPFLITDILKKDVRFNKYGQAFTLSIVQTVGLQKPQAYLLIALVIMLLVSFTLHLRSSIGRRNNAIQRDFALQQLAQEHNLLEQRVANRTNKLQQKSDENQRLANQIVRIQEDHYQHLARELHDDFGQLLSAIKINAHMIGQKDLEKQTARYIDEIITYSDNLYEKVHDLVQFLRPSVLDAFGLKVALKECMRQFKLPERNMQLDLQLEDVIDDMEEPYIIATYRIAQELVNNVVKHAQASKLQVLVQVQSTKYLVIQVTDNGQGISAQSTTKQFGIHGLQERVSTLGGTLERTNLSEGGLRVKVTLPYRKLT